MAGAARKREPQTAGRYAICDEIAAGGMATVHIGRLLGPIGFARTIAVKRLHRQYADDPDFRSMLVDEGRLAARIQHPNVVQTLDIVTTDTEIFVVMEFVTGETLARLLRAVSQAGGRVPLPIAVAILSGVLHGLHAAHEAVSEQGAPLDLVHRDISPQNILVGVDGAPRVLDFGVAKATGRLQTTRDGQLKGKLAYMAPEQLGGKISRRVDIYAASIVLWEMLTGRRLFAADDERELVSKVLFATVEPPSALAPEIGEQLDDIVMRGLDHDPDRRFATAREMALALEARVPLATAAQVGTWVEQTARDSLAKRSALVRRIEQHTWQPYEASLDSGTRPIAPVADPESVTSIDAPRIIVGEDPSSVSLATAPRPSRARGGARLPTTVVAALIGGTFVLGAATAIIVGPRLRRSERLESASGATTATSAAIVPVVSAAPPAAVEAPPVAALATASASAAVPAPTRNAHARTPPTPSGAIEPLPSTASALKPSCDPPYRIGPRGEKLWIAECL